MKPQEEERIAEFWEKAGIAEKARAINKGKKPFYFMDGPPYASGSIHLGTALNKILKDIAIRSKRMQGFDVFDRPGYDCHGVPIEYQVEKKLGFKTKKDIERYGVKKFVKECKHFATQFVDVMNKQFEDLGVWMDWSNPYLTLDDNYIEAIWWTFKKAAEQGLLYLDKYPVHICPRCETAVAFNEIEYKRIEDVAIYVKFLLKGKENGKENGKAKEKEKGKAREKENGEGKGKENKFLLVWTTTPWTLPGNTAVMVNPNFSYSQIKLENGERWIVASKLAEKIMSTLKLNYNVEKEFLGKELEGLSYENPLSPKLKLKMKNAYRVVLSSRYVNLEEGTGLVHCAPGHGKEDYEVGKENGLDMPCPVTINGLLTEEAGKYAGKKAREVDSEIISDLEASGFLAGKHLYSHDYPHCWRCHTPLLLLSVPQWFFKISSIQPRLLELNQHVKWQPRWMQARMQGWLQQLSDWPISRQRYWGTPLPIWICKKCGKQLVVGSISELKKLSRAKNIGMHKPEIDAIKIKCKCGSEMERVPEVLDVWFDSGVSSWAALGFPSEQKLFKSFWPADLNIEGKDQIRGWWNSQLITSTICFDAAPFKAIAVHGMVLDIDKRKMAKSLGNVIMPKDVIEKYGRDFLRYYLASTSRGEDFGFDWNAFKEIEKVFTILQNVQQFISTYCGFELIENINTKQKQTKKLRIEDRWILSRLNSLIQEVLTSYNDYTPYKVIEKLEQFIITDLSRIYIKLVRERVLDKEEKKIVGEILNRILFVLARLLAPIAPFTAEHIYQTLKGKTKKYKAKTTISVHLCRMPSIEKKIMDKKLEENFEKALKLVEIALAQRAASGVPIRWPLSLLEVKSVEADVFKNFEEIIKKQVNVKALQIEKCGKGEERIRLDTKLTPELEAEGYAREIARLVQEARKKAGLERKDNIELLLQLSPEMLSSLQKYGMTEFIGTRTGSKKLLLVSLVEKTQKYKNESEAEIKGKKVIIKFKKV